VDGLPPDVHGHQMTLALHKDFGERMRALRIEAGRSQEEFAALVNIDRATYGKLERGEINPSLITLARIAVALDTSLSGLLNGITLNADEVRKIPRLARGPTPIAARARPGKARPD
jgi:transcriptional regulator with XRE-family HTH domain